MTALPAFIDKEAWQGFCDMRKAIKKPIARQYVLRRWFNARLHAAAVRFANRTPM